MKHFISAIWIFLASGIFLGHGFIPHHHHAFEAIQQHHHHGEKHKHNHETHSHQEDHNHHGSVPGHQIDNYFVVKTQSNNSFNLQLNIPVLNQEIVFENFYNQAQIILPIIKDEFPPTDLFLRSLFLRGPPIC